MILDPHVHTIYSIDGYSTPRDIARVAEMRNGIIAVTDHDAVRGAIRARELSNRIIVGEEVSTRSGHVLALGIDGEIRKGLGVGETVEEIHDHGGVAIGAHPFRIRSGAGKRIDERFDGIEVLNARTTMKANNRASEYARHLGISCTGGSDAHMVEFIFVAYTEFEGDSAEDALEAIRRGKTRAAGRVMNRESIMEQKIINFFILTERVFALR